MVAQLDLHMVISPRIPGTSITVERLPGTGDNPPPGFEKQLSRRMTNAARSAGQHQRLSLAALRLQLVAVKRAQRDIACRPTGRHTVAIQKIERHLSSSPHPTGRLTMTIGATLQDLGHALLLNRCGFRR
jgi:hypothetical protein